MLASTVVKHHLTVEKYNCTARLNLQSQAIKWVVRNTTIGTLATEHADSMSALFEQLLGKFQYLSDCCSTKQELNMLDLIRF